jgi:hypothetical protein
MHQAHVPPACLPDDQAGDVCRAQGRDPVPRLGGRAGLLPLTRRADRLSAPTTSKIGKEQVSVEVASVIRASGHGFRVEWVERRYVDDALASTERWSAIPP